MQKTENIKPSIKKEATSFENHFLRINTRYTACIDNVYVDTVGAEYIKTSALNGLYITCEFGVTLMVYVRVVVLALQIASYLFFCS